jgi:uncharacterized protein with LGFP repeats
MAALCAAAMIVVPVAGPRPADVAAAADTRQFDPGNIITDQLFFNGGAMSAGDIQTFLNVRNPNCVAGSDGTPCLKNYRQSTWTRTASDKCPYDYVGAANETAATIIYKVGQACGISQRVLLVILQKEQGLVTASGSSLYPTRYRAAMGMGCPDTAACDSQYYGFFNQVYSAAAQYKKYAVYPNNYGHRAGTTNNVRYHPDVDCGSSPVFIRNQATAGLYNYTPYQPNAAALAAGKGLGDGCSAYGNRNFWIYFTDWFGSTQTAGAGDLADLYVSTGAENGPLGAVTQGVTCGLRNGGCKQGYENGWIFWSPSTGARALLGPIKDLWVSTGAERGVLGYPTQSVSNVGDGVGQYAHFEGGSIYWSPSTGARALLGPIKSFWQSTGGLGGALGYPTRSVSNAADGVGQYAHFTGGSVYWSPSTGARALMGPIKDFWLSTGGTGGLLGYPTQSVSTLPDGVGRYAHFTGGSVYWSPSTGARALLGPIRDLWSSSGAETGPLGYPTQSVSTAADGVGQYARFQNGSMYWTQATGAQALSGPIEALWIAAGAEQGPLGYPTSSVSTAADGTSQYAHFQNGSVYRTAGGVVSTVTGAVRDLWVRTGADGGPLGPPTSDTEPTSDGAGEQATFQNGAVYWSAATGAAALSGPILTRWLADGAEQSPLGYPTGSVAAARDGVGQVAHFQGGSAYWSSATGVHVVTGPVRTLWNSTRGELGLLGYPVADVGPTSDGVGEFGRFQGGSIYSSPDTGTRALLGAIQTLWDSTGGVTGLLGYPTQSVSTTRDGRGQYAQFQGGSVYWTSTTGARAVLGPIRTLWLSTGAEQGLLGYPTQSVSTAPDGVGQYARFEGGSIYWSPSTGTRAMLGAVETLWRSTGAERGSLGYPTQSVSTTRDGLGQYAHFEHGSIYWTPSTGARALLGPVRDRWVADGAERGALGYPTQSVSNSADGVGQYARFQRGSIYWSPSTNAHVVTGTFLTAYTGAGAERGRLGYPTSDAYAVNGGTWQDFQHGRIARSTATGRTWVVYR